jgi:Kef-type K+ transport system membrane component KefB
VTAVPVLGRVFDELGLSHTRTAALSIGAAALNDVLGWLVLGGIAAYVRGSWDAVTLVTQLASIVLGLALVFMIVAPVLGRIVGWELSSNDGRLPPRAIGLVLFVVCIAATVSSSIGVFALIGALVVGIAMHGQRALAAEWERSVAPLVHALFVPLFFTLTGLRTDLGNLDGAAGLLALGAVCVIALATKLSSSYVAARMFGESQRTSLAVGVAMNTRGLMELVALNVGLELGILPRPMFTVLVLAAVISTYIASPLLRQALKPRAMRHASTHTQPSSSIHRRTQPSQGAPTLEAAAGSYR